MDKKKIMNAVDAIQSMKEELFKIYREDYHQTDDSILNKRWNNTIFITDVKPEEEKTFTRDMHLDLKDFLRIQMEYMDYMRQRKRIHKEIKEEFAEGLKTHFKVPPYVKRDVLWNLDFEACQLGATDQNRKFAFLNECMQNEIHDIRDWQTIEDILKRKKILLRKEARRLIEETKWGQRLLREHPELSSENLSEIILDETAHASTNLTRCKDGQLRTVCYLPLMKYESIQSIDRMVLHELRHVVEMSDEKCGLDVFKEPVFKQLNEIRTEQNAKRDENRLPVIFKKNPDCIQSYYDILMPALTHDDIDVELMNLTAFQEDPNQIRETLGLSVYDVLERINEEEKTLARIRKGQ